MRRSLQEYGLTAIEDVQDLGFFSWTPKGGYKKLHQVTAEEIRRSVDLRGVPPQVQPIGRLQEQCPRALNGPKKSTKKNNARNEYPYNPSYLVPLYVALKDRDVQGRSIDFVFGGSVLHTLATGSMDSAVEYRAQKVPGQDTIVIEKYMSYTTNYNDFGFRFEQFVCGEEASQATFEHLQLMTVNGSNILISAESDAVDEEGNGVELKTSNPKNWKSKVAFQMISNGSQTLYWGEKTGTTKYKQGKEKLKTVHALSLNDVCDRAFGVSKNVRMIDKRLRDSMDVLVKASKDGLFDGNQVFTLHFKNGELTLHPVSMLPTESAVHDLLGSASETNTVTRTSHASASIHPTREELISRFKSGTLTESEELRIESLPDEVLIGMGYIPDDFCGFDSD